MGNTSSKAATKAASTASRRQYPSTSSILNSASSTSPYPSSQSGVPPNTTPSPSQVHPDPKQSPPSDTKASHIDLDGRDPQFASSLRKLGPAVSVEDALPNQQKFPTSSTPPVGQQGRNIFPSTTSSSGGPPSTNASVRIVQTRERINQTYAAENNDLGRGSFTGRTLITGKEISDIIRLTHQGRSEVDIEKSMRLKPGIVRQLVGTRGLVDNV